MPYGTFANPLEELMMMMQGQMPPGQVPPDFGQPPSGPGDDDPRAEAMRRLMMQANGLPPTGIAGAGGQAPGLQTPRPPQMMGPPLPGGAQPPGSRFLQPRPPAPDSRIPIFPGLSVPNPFTGQTIRNPFTGVGVQSPIIRQPPVNQPVPPLLGPGGAAPPPPAGPLPDRGAARVSEFNPERASVIGATIGQLAGQSAVPGPRIIDGTPPPSIVSPFAPQPLQNHAYQTPLESVEAPPIVTPAEFLRQQGLSLTQFNAPQGPINQAMEGYRAYVGEAQNTFNQMLQRSQQERLANQQLGLQQELGRAREGREFMELFGGNGTPGRLQTNADAVNRQFGPDYLNAQAFERHMSEGRLNGQSAGDLMREWTRTGRTIPVHAGGSPMRTPGSNVVLPGANGGPRIVNGPGAAEVTDEPLIGDTPLNQLLMRLSRPGTTNPRTGEHPPRVPITSFLEGAMGHAGLGPVFPNYIGDVIHFMQQQGYGAPGANTATDPDFNTWWTTPENISQTWSNRFTGAESRDQALRNRLARMIQEALPASGIRPTRAGDQSSSFSWNPARGFQQFIQQPLPPGLADQLRRARNQPR